MRAGRNMTAAAVLVVTAVVLATGCGREAAEPVLPLPESRGAGAAAAEPTPGPVAGAFVPPATLAELERAVTWVDRPVRDAWALAREHDAPAPGNRTAAETLALPNDSPDANARVLAALFRPLEPGRRAPVDGIARHLVSDVDSLNPLLADTAAEFDILGLTGFGLFGFDRTLAPFANADTVASWQSSTDGLLDKVVLRKDLTWSDGRPVTAGDVAFSWRLVVDPRVPARAFRDAAKRLRDVHAYDDRTVVFFHEEPLATAARNIDFPVLPRHLYARSWDRDPTLTHAAEHVALEAKPVTGGPYEVAARIPGREILLRRRAGWSVVGGRKVREAPPFAEIRFRVFEDPDAALAALEGGSLDEATLTARQWATATSDEPFTDRLAKVMTPEWRSVQFAWNLDGPLFADRGVRRAMGYAFDQRRLLESLCHGLAVPGTGLFPPGSWLAGRQRFEPCRQDLAKAEALLDEAGWIDRDGDGVRDREIAGQSVRFEFSILCERRPFHVATCALLRECLARIGVNCTVAAVEPDVLRERLRDRRFDACLVSWGTGVDPDTAASLWQSDGARNFCGYANTEVDRLFAEGRRERDRSRREATYARIEEILSEDQPCTWLFWQQEFRGFSRRLADDLGGFRGPARWSPGLSSIWQPTVE